MDAPDPRLLAVADRIHRTAVALERIAAAVEVIAFPFRIAFLPIRLVRRLLRKPVPPPEPTPAAPEPVTLPLPAPAADGDLLMLCPDLIGHVRMGIGMRHWEIARALAARGLRVTLASTQPLPPDLRGDGFTLVPVTRDTALSLVRRHRALFIQGGILEELPDVAKATVPVAVDLVCPMHLENLEKSDEEYALGRRLVLGGLARGDFFVCGNERQRLHYLGMMAAVGTLTRRHRAGSADLRELIDVLPFGLPADRPVKRAPAVKGVLPGVGPDDFLLTWFGGIWDWMDPAALVRGVAAAAEREPRLKLFFTTYRRPSGEVPEMARRTRDLCERLGLTGKCVFFGEYPIPFERRADLLLETDAGVLAQAPNLETQLSARTRMLDYVWTGCPMVTTDGDEWADAAKAHGFGIVLSDNRPDAWRDALLSLVRNPETVARMRAAMERMRAGLEWGTCVEPLVRFAGAQTPAAAA